MVARFGLGVFIRVVFVNIMDYILDYSILLHLLVEEDTLVVIVGLCVKRSPFTTVPLVQFLAQDFAIGRGNRGWHGWLVRKALPIHHCAPGSIPGSRLC